MGGKGGVGKTSVMTGLAEWFEENEILIKLLDLDTENKTRGSLTHFFGGRVPKVNIHTPAGLDAFIDELTDGPPVILADMGAGAGQVTYEWFDKMYDDVTEAGIAFTAASRLGNRTEYLVVENSTTEHTDFRYWRATEQAMQFQQNYAPAVIHLDYRLPALENAARNHGATLGAVSRRATDSPELRKASLVMRAQSYRRRMFGEFDRVKELLLP